MRTIVFWTSTCVYQRFFNNFPIFSCDYFRKRYALCSEKSIVENNFETIRFYSIEKKSLFLYAFSSSRLSLSRLLRFSNIFSRVPTKKPLPFCFLLKFLSWCRCQHRITNYQSFHFSLFLPLGSHICDVHKKLPMLWPIPPPVSHSHA